MAPATAWGRYLSVHEGPQNISTRPMLQALKPGMICSNEPGYYKTGEYGIRIENLVVVSDGRGYPWRRAQDDGVRDHHAGADRPQSGRADIADRAEDDWLNAYHARVRAAVAAALDEDDSPGSKRPPGRSDSDNSPRHSVFYTSRRSYGSSFNQYRTAAKDCARWMRSRGEA